jgi:hypothetical protein
MAIFRILCMRRNPDHVWQVLCCGSSIWRSIAIFVTFIHDSDLESSQCLCDHAIPVIYPLYSFFLSVADYGLFSQMRLYCQSNTLHLLHQHKQPLHATELIDIWCNSTVESMDQNNARVHEMA